MSTVGVAPAIALLSHGLILAGAGAGASASVGASVGVGVGVEAAAGSDDVPPGPVSVGALIWHFQASWLALALALAAGCYLYGVLVLRRRGDAWPVWRTLVFLGPGLGAIAAVSVTGIEAYDDTLLSVHMVQHMVMSMVAPIFLALGAPVTLALRTLPRRPRAWLLAAVHSRVAKVLAFPLVAYALFVTTPFVLYFTGLYGLTMRSTVVHELVHLHFIAVGCLFFWPLLGVDPLPGRWPYPARALLMFLSTPFHTVLGLTIMQSRTLVGGDWYPSLHLAWVDPFADQRVAGGILWAGGELVSVTMLAVLVVQWMLQSDREARRLDRQLDREEAAAQRAVAERSAGERSAAERSAAERAADEPAAAEPAAAESAAADATSSPGPGDAHRARPTGTIPAAPATRQGASAT